MSLLLSSSWMQSCSNHVPTTVVIAFEHWRYIASTVVTTSRDSASAASAFTHMTASSCGSRRPFAVNPLCPPAWKHSVHRTSVRAVQTTRNNSIAPAATNTKPASRGGKRSATLNRTACPCKPFHAGIAVLKAMMITPDNDAKSLYAIVIENNIVIIMRWLRAWLGI